MEQPRQQGYHDNYSNTRDEWDDEGAKGVIMKRRCKFTDWVEQSAVISSNNYRFRLFLFDCVKHLRKLEEDETESTSWDPESQILSKALSRGKNINLHV